ncbi:MAG: potassium channel family protein [Leptolyngbyaceae cyanobacterium]
MNRSVSPPQYTHLLSVIVLRLLIVPFVGWGGMLSEILASFLFFYMTILIIQSYRLPRSLFMLFVAISSIGFVLDMILTLGWVPMTITPTLIVQVIYSLSFGSAAWLILQRLLQTSRVTMDTVKGGICVYLLLGYTWSLLYGIVYTLDPNAFSSALVTEEGSYLNMLYFSFITLTTLGFGDIVPVNEVASVLTILEALVGQIYPAVFMALLVSTYLAHRHLSET